ncbi:hypothetical protein PZ897_03965 [Hoeflea sp. YIM 152468]|uniref:hypothetical protein n=1 Tax=Hoeflea sp. YIM 152468 TaxID=3031759 RepID=UPI0023DAA249|nr:hypothetical protein [Hoeflea sp. YIM 152468]MDF1607328.1 hypothetical protein [Hoeflea sp. YIM 152468]
MADKKIETPVVTDLGEMTGFLNPELAHQQQQQQQQQQAQSRRRVMNLETMLPEEEISTKLASEIKTFNQLVPRGKK